MADPKDKCPLCGEQMLSLACPGGCFTATAHEVDGLACKDRQRAREAAKAAKAAEPAEPADENQNYAAKFREAQKEIDRLTRERDEARAACAALWEAASFFRSMALCGEGPTKRSEEVSQVFKRVNPGQPLLNELDRLRRLEAGVGDDGLRTNVALTAALKGMEPLDVAELYRAALLAAMKGETK